MLLHLTQKKYSGPHMLYLRYKYKHKEEPYDQYQSH